jgi:hypothetical protein
MDPFLWLLVWHVEAEYINCALGLCNVQNPILDTRTQNKQELRKLPGSTRISRACAV